MNTYDIYLYLIYDRDQPMDFRVALEPYNQLGSFNNQSAGHFA